MYRLAVVLHLLGNVQQMGKYQLGYGVGTVGWNIRHKYTVLTGSLGINDIVASGQHADVLELRKGSYMVRFDAGFVGKYDFCTLCTGHYVAG